jgi:glyoxylase-like metal-dependent hydrolase (beta-lactamase superfamily II)
LRPAVKEILPGIYHWTAFHERIRTDVSSYYVADDPVTVLDPMVPDEGLDWFREQGAPGQILLTNRHHYRHSDRFVETFGCPVRCERSGLYEFNGGPDVEGFEFGDQLAARATALEMDAICSEDTVVHIGIGDGALAFADSLIHYGGSVGFVPDQLMDEPEDVKRKIRRSVERLLAQDFDSLLFAHGDPLVGGGKQALRDFLER